MNTERDRSNIQENLVSLYLRLNGFFCVQGLIVHSPNRGQNLTEVDVLGLRMPFHAEPVTSVPPDPILDLSQSYIDLVICESKSRGQRLQFNPPLQTTIAVESVLRWSGLVGNGEIASQVKTVMAALDGSNRPVILEASAFGDIRVRIRGVIFCLDRENRRHNQTHFITGSEVMNYVRRCLVPNEPRETCATRYDFSLWKQHEPIVRYFKSLGSTSTMTLDALCDYVGNA